MSAIKKTGGEAQEILGHCHPALHEQLATVPVSAALLRVHFSCKLSCIMHKLRHLCTTQHTLQPLEAKRHNSAIFQTLLTPHFAAIVLYYTEWPG